MGYKCFNPRTYIRYDLLPKKRRIVLLVFQSTYLYKVRHALAVRAIMETGFNPRTYIRYDDSVLPKWLTYRVSIHVPI